MHPLKNNAKKAEGRAVEPVIGADLPRNPTPDGLLRILAGYEGSMNVRDGVLWLETGQSIDLAKIIRNGENALLEQHQEMLEALKRALPVLEGHNPHRYSGDCVDIVRAAIAKAGGLASKTSEPVVPGSGAPTGLRRGDAVSASPESQMGKHNITHETTGKRYAAGIGGFRTYDLETARALHESQGGFLLLAGSNPPLFVVADEAEARECWGRTDGQLRDLENMHDSTEVQICSVPEDGEYVERCAKDILPGDQVDLESCPYLKEAPSAEWQLAEVVAVERETETCVAISYEGVDTVGYDPDVKLRCLAVQFFEGVTVRAIQEVREGMLIAFPAMAMEDTDDGDWARIAGPGEIATVGGRNADGGDWSVVFKSSGCWVWLEDEFIRQKAREVVVDPKDECRRESDREVARTKSEGILAGDWAWRRSDAPDECRALADVLPAIRTLLARYDLEAYSYLTKTKGEDGGRPAIRVCIPLKNLDEDRRPQPSPVRTWDEEGGFLGLVYPAEGDWVVRGLREDLEDLGVFPVRRV